MEDFTIISFLILLHQSRSLNNHQSLEDTTLQFITQIRATKMIKNYYQSVEIIIHNPSRSYILDHLYRIIIISRSGSGKTNVLLNLIKHQRTDIDKIYLYVKDSFESNYQLLINGWEKVGVDILKNPKPFTDYSQSNADVYENLEDYNPTKKMTVLIVFYDIIADMEPHKKSIPVATELFLRGRKFNILFVFISQSYFKVRKTITLNATHYFIMKIPSKRKLQQIASNH